QQQQQQQQLQKPQNQQQIPNGGPGWPQHQPFNQQQQPFLQYNSHPQYPIPYPQRTVPITSYHQNGRPIQAVAPSYPITSAHLHYQLQQQQRLQPSRWMDTPGTSSGSFSGNTPVTSGAGNASALNGHPTTSGFLQFPASSSTAAGFNGQVISATSSTIGGTPGNSSSNGQPMQICASLQSMNDAQKKKMEDYYNAERARESARGMAAAANQLFGVGGGAGGLPGSSTSPQKVPKLEGLPAGVIPAGGIRKPKQQRPPRADVAQPGAAGAVDAASSSSAIGISPSTTTIPAVPSGPVRRPDANATGGEIVAYLMTFNIQQREAEAEFASKALESLHKKIKDRPHDMETFIRCVETKGEVPGACITVTRTLDGRLQVAGRKGFPHVIYTKIFRFQELHKNELKSIPSCLFGFDNKAENEEHKPDAQVCVNPYHYERVTAPSGGGATHLDPLSGLLKANGFHSMDDMMDFATSSRNHIKMSTASDPSPSKKEKRRSSGMSGDWPVVDLDDDDEGDAFMPQTATIDSSAERQAPANPAFQQDSQIVALLTGPIQPAAPQPPQNLLQDVHLAHMQQFAEYQKLVAGAGPSADPATNLDAFAQQQLQHQQKMQLIHQQMLQVQQQIQLLQQQQQQQPQPQPIPDRLEIDADENHIDAGRLRTKRGHSGQGGQNVPFYTGPNQSAAPQPPTMSLQHEAMRHHAALQQAQPPQNYPRDDLMDTSEPFQHPIPQQQPPQVAAATSIQPVQQPPPSDAPSEPLGYTLLFALPPATPASTPQDLAAEEERIRKEHLLAVQKVAEFEARKAYFHKLDLERETRAAIEKLQPGSSSKEPPFQLPFELPPELVQQLLQHQQMMQQQQPGPSAAAQPSRQEVYELPPPPASAYVPTPEGEKRNLPFGLLVGEDLAEMRRRIAAQQKADLRPKYQHPFEDDDPRPAKITAADPVDIRGFHDDFEKRRLKQQEEQEERELKRRQERAMEAAMKQWVDAKVAGIHEQQSQIAKELEKRRQDEGLPRPPPEPLDPRLAGLLEPPGPSAGKQLSGRYGEATRTDRDKALLGVLGLTEEEQAEFERKEAARSSAERARDKAAREAAMKGPFAGRPEPVPEDPPKDQEELDARIEFNMIQKLEKAFPQARTGPVDASHHFLHARPSMMEELRLGNPPPLGGFGYQSLSIKQEPPSASTSKVGGDNGMSSKSSLSPEEITAAAVNAIAAVRAAAADMPNDSSGEALDAVMTDDDQGGNNMLRFFDPNYESSSSDCDPRELLNARDRLYLAGITQIFANKMEIDCEMSKRKLDEMTKAKEDAEAVTLNSDDSDYFEEMVNRQMREKELQEQKMKHLGNESELAKVQIHGDDLNNYDDPTVWNSYYTDNDGNPSYSRANDWLGQPPNPNVVVGEIGNGTYGSKGPHRHHRQKMDKGLEWSLQQVVKMLELASKDGDINSTQYMICCQHYIGMVSRTQAAHSVAPEQQLLYAATLQRIKEMSGGKLTTQQLHPWDIHKIFENHLKTDPQRKEEREQRRRKFGRDPSQFEIQWEIEINAEVEKVIAETKGTDAEGIFTRKQMQNALEMRQRIIKGEKIVPDTLMEIEELKSPFAKKFVEMTRKRKAEEVLEDKDQDMDLNSDNINGLSSKPEENGSPMDTGESSYYNPILPVLENAFTGDDLYTLYQSPSQYLQTFRDTILGEDQMVTAELEEQMDTELRGVVPPPEGDANFQPFDGRERENDEPDENGEERPPFKKNCLCPEDEKKKHCFWGKHHHYQHGVSREIVDAAFILYRYRIQRKKTEGPKGELYNFSKQFDCPKVCMTRTTEIEPHSAKAKPVNYNWCAVNYCEKDQHVGGLQQVSEPNYFIDGGFETNSRDKRYCVGMINSPLTRFDKEVQDVKSKIGCGIRISVKEDGSMWVRVLTRYPVFVTSTYLDREAGFTNGDTIHKVYPGTAIKVFDLIRARRSILQLFDYQSVSQTFHRGYKKQEDLPYPLRTFNRRELRSISRIGGDDMHRHTVVKIGFQKGWGPEYEHKKICETPCWVEIINNRACEFIDHIMTLRPVTYAYSDIDSSDYDD
ncbi:hypothetical protein PENTCL1PPCAC_28131, partial [Pristionchus entomophagus]